MVIYSYKLLCGDKMKRKLICSFSLILSLIMLSGCSSDILKTKTVSTELLQTQVVLNSKIAENTDYAQFLKAFSPSSVVVPGLFEGVIPQGLCYSEALDAFIISGYYEDGAYPSVIMLVDAKSKALTAYHPLKKLDGDDYNGHAGGIACSDDYFFITSDNEAVTISLSAVKAAKNGEALTFESVFKLTTNGAFVTISGEILWTGDFVESADDVRSKISDITTLDSGETFYAYCEGYTLKDGLPDVAKINSNGDGYIPDYYLAIPEQAQGMTVLNNGDMMFTTSYGRKKDSYIKLFDDILAQDPVSSKSVDGVAVPLFACSADKLKKNYTSPPMVEGVVTVDDTTYVLFESGAAKYRSHGGKYPIDTLYTAKFE